MGLGCDYKKENRKQRNSIDNMVNRRMEKHEEPRSRAKVRAAVLWDMAIQGYQKVSVVFGK